MVEAKGLDKVLPSKRKVYCTMEVQYLLFYVVSLPSNSRLRPIKTLPKKLRSGAKLLEGYR